LDLGDPQPTSGILLPYVWLVHFHKNQAARYVSLVHKLSKSYYQSNYQVILLNQSLLRWHHDEIPCDTGSLPKSFHRASNINSYAAIMQKTNNLACRPAGWCADETLMSGFTS
jgi:hypothetical protein